MPTLLLADDSTTVQRVIALTFAEEGFLIVAVPDGQAAIDQMASQPPDIVLASTTMANVDGYDVASFVRSQPALSEVPVLLLADAFEPVDPARLKASGASGVLEKPLDPTIVISRVRALLGITGDARPAAPAGRLGSADATPEKRMSPQREAPASSRARPGGAAPVRPANASTGHERGEEAGLEPDAQSVDASRVPGQGDYLDTLDEAFDLLDRHLAGRRADDRNPSPPLGQRSTDVDPRSPHRRPQPSGPPEGPQGNSIFEVDDQWFAENDRLRENRGAEQREQLAAEMGIHGVELPETPETANADDEPQPTRAATQAGEPERPVSQAVPPVAPAPDEVADDFAALLAIERGEHLGPLMASHAPPVEGHAPAPEITDAMLDRIAARVAERLSSGSFADHLRDALTTTVSDTVRSVVSETSERLVSEEIARVKAKAERDTP